MTTEPIENISLKREELYEQVWTTPVVKLAKIYGLSDVAIGKICKKYFIPKPTLGYWAKVSHGKIVPRPRLPTINDERLSIVQIRKRPLRPDRKRPTSRDRPTEASITVPERLTAPHVLVSNTLIQLKSNAPDRNGVIRPRAAQCLDVSVGRNNIGRAMRLMDALLKTLEKQGCRTSVAEKDRKYLTCVHIFGQTIEIQIRELLDRREKQFTAAEKKEREKSSWLRDRIEYEYFPSGRLALNVLNYLDDGCRRLWSDGKKQRLENCLGSVIDGLIVAAEVEKARHLRWEQREKERLEREQERLKEEERKRKEQEKIARLENLTNSWRKSQNIREFAFAIEKAFAENNVTIGTGSELANWLHWARNYAESIDPVALTLRSRLKTDDSDKSNS